MNQVALLKTFLETEIISRCSVQNSLAKAKAKSKTQTKKLQSNCLQNGLKNIL